MKKIILSLFAICFFLSSGILVSAAANPHVLIQTELGDIALEIFVDKAPVTANNFLEYVRRGLYREAVFYRVLTEDNQPQNKIKVAVIQGGILINDQAKPLLPIAHETTKQTGIRHKDGVISLARSKPGTASSDFFICIGDQPEVDFGGMRNPDGLGFAAFGRVVKGMEVVRRIQRQPTKGQMLNPFIKISEFKLIEHEKESK